MRLFGLKIRVSSGLLILTLALPVLLASCREPIERAPHRGPEPPRLSPREGAPGESFHDRSENRRRQRHKALEPLRPEPQYRILP